jgi:vacuolar-type H+-ATPase subunit E/Vma4
MRQNAAAAKTLRQDMTDVEHSPLTVLTDLAIEGTSSFIEAQKILLHLALEENQIVMNGVKERVAGSPRGVAMTDLVRRSLDTLLRMQQDFLKTASKQTTQWLEAVKDGKGAPGPHLVDLAQEEMDNFVQAQKKFLDVISEETARATSGTHGSKAKTRKQTELSRLAREATDSFITAQKRLIDVVGQQVNMNLKAATRSLEMASTGKLLPVASVAKEGIQSLVGAERALIDSLVKPRKDSKSVRVTEHRGGRTVHPRKAPRVRSAHAGA